MRRARRRTPLALLSLFRLAALFLAALCPDTARLDAAPPPGAGASRPNVIFIFSDDHASHAISAYGSRINRDPEHRPTRERGRAVPQHVLRELDLRPEPRATILTGRHCHLSTAS